LPALSALQDLGSACNCVGLLKPSIVGIDPFGPLGAVKPENPRPGGALPRQIPGQIVEDNRMRVRAETVDFNPVPDDVVLMPIIAVAAALGCSERSARGILAAHGAKIVVVGPRSHKRKHFTWRG
jgi:hypothetical protein